MKRILFALFALAQLVGAQISSLSLPHTIDSAVVPKVSYVDDNDVALKNHLNIVIDSVNADSVRTLIQSLSNLRLTTDADNNATGTCFAVTTNGATDTIAKFCDDLSGKVFGALTVAGASTFTGAATFAANPVMPFTANKIPFSHTDGSGTMTSSANLTYTSGTSTLATVNETLSGTLGVTGTLTGAAANFSGKVVGSDTIRAVGSLVSQSNIFATGSNLGYWINTPGTFTYGMYQTGTSLAFRSGSTSPWLTVDASGLPTFANVVSASEAIAFVANGTEAAGRIYRSASNGLEIRGVAGSGQDFMLKNKDGNAVLQVATGTTVANFPGTGITIAGTATTTGKHTFTAAPRFSSANASEFLLTDGSKDLTSVGGTGSGSVVRQTSAALTSPTLTTPVLGAATGTSLSLSGNATVDSLISPKLHDEGTFTFTLTGCTTSPTGTARWTRLGKMVFIRIPTMSGTSNSTGMTLTGLPASLIPANGFVHSVPVLTDNGTSDFNGQMICFSGIGTLTLQREGSIGFTSSGTKGIPSAFGITYTLQ
jgi:hypothetical protein